MTNSTIAPGQSSSVKLDLFARETGRSFSTEPTAVSDMNAPEFFRHDHTTSRFTDGRVHKDNFEVATALVFVVNETRALEVTRWLKQRDVHFLTVTLGREVRVYLPFSTPLADKEKFVACGEWFRKNIKIAPRPLDTNLPGCEDVTPSVENGSGEKFVDDFLRNTVINSAGERSGKERKPKESLPAPVSPADATTAVLSADESAEDPVPGKQPEVVIGATNAPPSASDDEEPVDWGLIRPLEDVKGLPETEEDFHPYAKAFPMLEGAEFETFCNDIAENGQVEPIVVHKDPVTNKYIGLDGRNRFKACVQRGIKPRFVEYIGNDPIDYIKSKNIHRRHLTESQRALLAAQIANMSVGQSKKNSANLQNTTQSEAAEKLKVSIRSVASGAKVLNGAVPEIIEAVKSGNLAVSAAATLVDASEETQREVAAVAAKGNAKETADAVQKGKQKPSAQSGASDDDAKEHARKILAEINRRMTEAIGIPGLFNEIIDGALPCDDADWDAARTAVLEGCDTIIKSLPPDSTHYAENA